MGIFVRKRHRQRREDVEHEKIVRIEKAETELFDLKLRASRAINRLESRSNRNHWREAIETMIQGTL